MEYQRRVDLCGSYYAAAESITTDTTRYVSFPLLCKTWDCQKCREVKTRGYLGRMTRLFDGRGLWFYTLTYKHDLSPGDAWRTYSDAWNRLRTHVSKKYGSFNYVRVLESHNESPYPHLHVIADIHIPEKSFGVMAISAGFGYQLQEKKITDTGAKRYLTKYLTKEWKNEEGWKLRRTYRCRLISFSRGLLDRVQRGHEWNLLIRGESLENCIDNIKNAIEWRTSRGAVIIHEKYKSDYYELTLDWTNEHEFTPTRLPDDWEPDDWVPK
jgi:hypothetical protein